MNDFYILIIAHNEKESVKMMIESIRMAADVDNLSVVLVDNFSSDGLWDWAENQEDITCVLMDEREIPVGHIINEVIDELQIRGDILIIGGHYIVAPGCLSHMQKALYLNDGVGAVSGLSNGFWMHQRSDSSSKLIQNILTVDESESKKVIGFYSDAVLFKGELLQETGKFDENRQNMYYILKDYCLKAVLKGWQLRVCNSSFFFKTDGFNFNIYNNVEGEKFLEEKWGMHYFNLTHNDNLIDKINSDSEDEIWVLEIGCDCGANLVEIQNRYPRAHLYGCELNEKAASIASCFAPVIKGNIEEKNLNFGNETFDYIIFGDVLEHLHDPQETVKYCRRFLKEDGCIVASIPNVMNISVVEELLNGNFTYEETGLLDKTHIHFFTFYELVRMFQESGYEIEDIGMTVNLISDQQRKLIDQLLLLQSGSERFMYEAFQYLIRARKREI